MTLPLKNLNSEIDSLQEASNIIKTTFHRHCTDMMKDIISYSPDSYGDTLKLRTQMTKFAETQKEIDAIIHGVNEINSLIDQTNLTEEGATKKFEELVKEFVEENDIDDEQKEILTSLDDFINGEQAEQETEVELDDSELLVTKTTQSYKDPLTQRIMKDPVRSKICNHAFEKSSILAYLGESKKRCPYSGCQSVLGRKDLVEHFTLKLKLCALEEEEELI